MRSSRKIRKDFPLEELDQWPPFHVWAAARRPFKGGTAQGLSLAEVAKASGLSARTVSRVAQKLTWADEKLKVIDAFMRGCNFKLSETWRHREYLKKNLLSKHQHFSHLSTKRWRVYLKKCEQALYAQ